MRRAFTPEEVTDFLIKISPEARTLWDSFPDDGSDTGPVAPDTPADLTPELGYHLMSEEQLANSLAARNLDAGGTKAEMIQRLLDADDAQVQSVIPVQVQE